jgi:hypothetical protein
VALDVARVLAKSADELASTDIPEPVLDVLRTRPVSSKPLWPSPSSNAKAATENTSL